MSSSLFSSPSSPELIPSLSNRIPCHHFLIAVDGEEESGIIEWCNQTTELGTLCAHHADEDLGLAVRPSLIQEPGLGLFTTRMRRKGEKICEYEGQLVPKDEFQSLSPSAYGIETPDGRSVLNAVYTTDGFARFINSRTTKNGGSEWGTNCLFLSDRQYANQFKRKGSSKGGNHRTNAINVIAKKKIPAGEELLVSYGSQYW